MSLLVCPLDDVFSLPGHASVCALLLDLGRADPNAPATDGDTPLFLASRRGRASAVSVLLSKGADPNQTNR